MSTRTVEQVDSWDTVPFSGGYGGLHELADDGFSGAVIAGPARLFMLNGKVVGILDGSIEDFEDASATARRAPHPGLPLLAVMQERSDEVRAKYYTEDTPLEEVDQTLSSGGFTGFVELSENVLSGDYYQIYHQGRSMSVAWVGNSDQLIIEDEAFEQANDEVGIYEVRQVDIEIIDIPDAPDTGGVSTVTDDTDSEDEAGVNADSESSVGGATDSGDGQERSATDTDDGQGPSATGTDPVAKTGIPTRSDTTGPTTDEDATAAGESRPTNETTARASDRGSSAGNDATSEDTTDVPGTDRPNQEPRPDETTAASDPETVSREEPSRDPARTNESRTRSESAGETRQSGTERQHRESQTQPADSGNETSTQPDRPTETATEPSPTTASHETNPARRDSTQRAGEQSAGAVDLETRSIPSLDPAHSETASSSTPDVPPEGTPDQSTTTADTPQASADHPAAPSEQSRPPSSEQRQESQRQTSTQESERQRQSGQQTSEQRVIELESDLEASRERVAELEMALDEAEAQQERLREERDALAEERDELESELAAAREEIDRLEERLEEMAADDPTASAETRLSKGEAIDGTNLFVRYHSKGDATLEAVHSGNADRPAVDDNLRLEFHTQFDADTAAVGNQEFEAFLTGSIQYRFVDWLVRNLLYEIRDTGNPDAMGGLYDALPKIDRAELNGQVSVEYTEDGEQRRAQEQFDVVVRDRMGNPLIVANINNSRDPATDDMMTDLITRAERVGSSSDSLAGAFLVTESFFEPPALETAEEATSSGLLNRDKRKSFVNLSRKGGYHLCLVEARNREFHLAVPEL